MIKDIIPWKRHNAHNISKYRSNDFFTEFHDRLDNLFSRLFDDLNSHEWLPYLSSAKSFEPKFDIRETKKTA